MKLLKEMITEKGIALGPSILKVDSFLNHQIDPTLMIEVGKELYNRFKDCGINKILTIEASGIAVGPAAAYAFNVPLVFAKKKKPSTMNDSYVASIHSFTKQTDYTVCVSKEFLSEGDKVLIVDDFLAMGNAVLGLKEILHQAKADLVGVGIVIEKGFQEGSKVLEEHGIRLESLAVIESLAEGQITLK